MLSKLQMNVKDPPSKEVFRWSRIRLSSQTPENCDSTCLSLSADSLSLSYQNYDIYTVIVGDPML